MKHAVYFKVSKDLMSDIDTDFVSNTAYLLRSKINRQNVEYLKKGVRLLHPISIRAGEHGDDFVRNAITVIATRNGVKIPRIISRLLLSKIKKQ